MTSRIRPFLTAAAILAAAAFFQPDASAQGFGGMFSSFQLNGVSGDEMEASTVITAHSADIDLENNIIVLIGDVVVDDKSSRITCNRMEIYLDEDAADSLVGTADKPEENDETARPERKPEKETGGDENGDEPEEEEERKNIKRIDCVGDVVFRKRANPDSPDDSDEDQIAMAARADYDVVKDVIVMTGAHSAPGKVIPAELFENMVRQIRSNNIARCPVMMQGENWMVGESFTILLKEDNRLKVKEMRFNYIGDSFLPGESKDGNEDSAEASGDRKNSALISANDADIYIEHNIITLTGNVDVDQESDQPVRMTCDRMEIILVDDVPEKDGKAAAESGKKASEIHCTGEFVYRKRAGQDSNGEKDQIALSDRADYDAEKEILVLSGKPVMIQGANKVHGARIEIYPREDNRMAIDSMKAYYTGNALLAADDNNAMGATTLIAAARADIRPDELITLSKNVIVDDGSTQITCTRMDIALQKGASGSNSLFSFGTQADNDNGETDSGNDDFGKEVSQIICTGDFVYRRTSGGKEQTAMSDKAEYDAVSKTILLTEKPVIMQGLTIIYGSRIEIVQEKDNAHVNDMKMLYSDRPLFTMDKKSGEGTTTTITAKKADIDMKGSIAYLKDGVNVFDDFHKIVCREMDVHFRNDSGDEDGSQDEIAFENNSISEILCRGNVVYEDRNTLDESYGENRIAMSKEARFDGETGKLHMSGAHSTPKDFLSENLYEDALQGILHIMDENDAYRPTSWSKYDKNKKRAFVEERLQRHTIAVDEEKRVFLGESIDVFTKDTNHITVFSSYNRLYGFTFFQSGLSSDRETDDDSERPVDIASSVLDYNNNEILLRENVVIDDGVSKITCEKMKIFLIEETEDSTGHANSGKTEKPDAVPIAVPVAGTNENEDKKKDRDDNFLGSKTVSSFICTGNFTFLRRNKLENSTKEDLLVLSRFAEYHKEDNLVRASIRQDERSTFAETENEKREGDTLLHKAFYKESISDAVFEKITKKMIEDITKEPITYGAPRNWLLFNDLEKEKYCEGDITESVVALQGTEWATATEFMFSPDLGKRRFNGIKHTSGLLKKLSNTFK